MSDQTPPDRSRSVESTTIQRRRPPSWMVVGLLVLLGGWYVLTQVLSRTGPPIEWIRGDLAAAEKVAQEHNQRIFLLMHEPGCATTAANERDLFSQRLVRKRLAEMVCCRIELQSADPLRQRFHVRQGIPLMVVLEPGHQRPIGAPMEGKVDWRQFKTYVQPTPKNKKAE